MAYQVKIKVEDSASEVKVVKSKDEIIAMLILHIACTTGDSVEVTKDSVVVYS